MKLRRLTSSIDPPRFRRLASSSTFCGMHQYPGRSPRPISDDGSASIMRVLCPRPYPLCSGHVQSNFSVWAFVGQRTCTFSRKELIFYYIHGRKSYALLSMIISLDRILRDEAGGHFGGYLCKYETMGAPRESVGSTRAQLPDWSSG
jgi:hypothetical protein